MQVLCISPLIWLLITFSAVVTPVKMPQGHPGGIVAGVYC